MTGTFRCTARPPDEHGGPRRAVLVPEPLAPFRFVSVSAQALAIACLRPQDAMLFAVGHTYEIEIRDVTGKGRPDRWTT